MWRYIGAKQGLVIVAMFLFMSGCGSTQLPNISAERAATPTPDFSFERSTAPTPPATLPELIAALSSENAEIRIGAALVLGDMGPEAEAAVPALARNLYYQGSYEVRESAASSLGKIGPAAKPAVSLLEVALLADFVHVRRAAAIALGHIGDTAAIPALAQALNDKDNAVSGYAARSIATLTDQKFPDRNGPGFSIDKNGVPVVVAAAIEWWMQQGQYHSWLGP